MSTICGQPQGGKDQILRLLRIDIKHGEAFDTVEELQAIEEYIKWHKIERIEKRLKGLIPMRFRNQVLEPPTV